MENNWTGVYKLDICGFKESYAPKLGCIQCNFGQFITTFNSNSCSACNDVFETTSFENFLKIKYCPD